MTISYSVKEIARFNESCLSDARIGTFRENSGYDGDIRFGQFTIHGLYEDCTSVHINHTSQLFFNTQYENLAACYDSAKKQLVDVKRWMWYSGKNTAFLTAALYNDTNSYVKDYAARIDELGGKLVAIQRGGRSKGGVKIVFVILIEFDHVGYEMTKTVDFTQDPWYKSHVGFKQNIS